MPPSARAVGRCDKRPRGNTLPALVPHRREKEPPLPRIVLSYHDDLALTALGTSAQAKEWIRHPHPLRPRRCPSDPCTARRLSRELYLTTTIVPRFSRPGICA